MQLQKELDVIGAGILMFAASDAIAYATTGSGLVLGAPGRHRQGQGDEPVRRPGADRRLLFPSRGIILQGNGIFCRSCT
jgi:hypothetical protein